MRRLDGKVQTFVHDHNQVMNLSVNEIRHRRGHFVESFQELVEKVAELSFRNPQNVLFYRGQSTDYKNRNQSTTIYPRIFRSRDNYLSINTILGRFRDLDRFEDRLADAYQFDGSKQIRINKILRWAILQHYEICDTPLLDLTHSLRVAASFAHFNNSLEGYVYVIGLPQISGSITSSAEHGIQTIRLLSVCPPVALRPHYQEAYLVGEYPTISFKGKQEYERAEVDISRRLVCKFKIARAEVFWSNGFAKLPEETLLPNGRDAMYQLAERLMNRND